jgi:hypothetical protein
MSALDPRELRAIFGRLMIQMSLVWAGTMLGAAIAAKASDEFFWVLLILITGAGVSGAVIESARRRLPDPGRAAVGGEILRRGGWLWQRRRFSRSGPAQPVPMESVAL